MATSYGTVEADGVGAVAPVPAQLDDEYQDSARADGVATVSVSALGLLTQSARADGVATVLVTSHVLYQGRVEAHGTSSVFVAYAPEMGENLPIGIAMTFTAVAVVIPPELDDDQ